MGMNYEKIIVIRHCSATGQERDAELTTDGKKTSKHPCYIPLRAPSTNRPYYFKPICASYRFYSALCTPSQFVYPRRWTISWTHIKRRSNGRLDAKLESTFTNIDIAFSGGESTKQATDRAISLIQHVLKLNYTTTLLVTHGNLLTLILKYFDHTIGFHEWKALTNPDVYEIVIDEQCTIKRLWEASSK